MIALAAGAACSSNSVKPDAGTRDGGHDSRAADVGARETRAADRAPVGDGPSACPAALIVWGKNGGHVAYRHRFKLSSCSAFTAERLDGGGALLKSCSTTISANDPILVAALTDLRHADVTAALALGGLHGTDPRPYDGTVDEITVGSQTVLVGGDCPPQRSSCQPVKPALRDLATRLEALAAQELARPACSGV